MTARRHRIDFSLRRRRIDLSNTSSGSISPPVPILQSPVTFQAFASVSVSEATLKQKNKLERDPVRPSMFLEEKDDDEAPNSALTGGAPLDVKPVHIERKSVEEKPMTRTKSQYFEDAFSTRGPLTSPRTQISQDSVVVVEIKINTKIKEVESLVSNISSHMARIFQKSETLMMTTIQEDACIQFGRVNLPAYLMKVFALPYLIAPITNLRSTILIQAALQEILHVAPNRGVILYIPIPEENFATNGVTMMGEIARLERSSPDHGSGLFKTVSRTMSRRLKSTSSQSAPISVATTSSWACGGTQAPSPEKDSQASDATDGDVRSKSIGPPVALDRKKNSSIRFNTHSRHMEPSSTTGNLLEIQGSLFDAPEGAALIHACNCRGTWGKGIARVFRSNYPAAYEIYRSHCRQFSSKPRHNTITTSVGARRARLPEGTALIIPPQEKDYENDSRKRHWIICLFTSRGLGRMVSPENIVLENTELAIADMKEQLDRIEYQEGRFLELWSCRFNSGLFGVQWARSREILTKSGLDVTVVTPADE
ncbi:ADP-ribose 1''-phosphate phosphatase [Aspergillus niger]|nr:ADP-ribose 1''-phosphate phosphatase [Aspergillus niger]